MSRPRHALVRGVPLSFGGALTMAAKPQPLDPLRAAAQHAAYVLALRWLGLDVTVLPADEAFPDGCFVEDTAVLAEGVALITRPGAPSRRGEVAAVREALAASHRLVEMTEGGLLDGGDVLRAYDTLFIGRSSRTDDAGIAAARAAFPTLTVVPVDVADALHLKCIATPLGTDTILLADETVDPRAFAGHEVVLIPHDEAYAANVLAVGHTVLVAAGFPATAEALAARGYDVMTLELDAIQAADGSLTCLSLLW